jgi:YHS domain-containing protein
MTQANTIPETAVDPVCGMAFDPRKVQFTAKDDKGTHYFCSDACRSQFETADEKTKKGLWARYTDRLKKVHCTRTPPECR